MIWIQQNLSYKIKKKKCKNFHIPKIQCSLQKKFHKKIILITELILKIIKSNYYSF
jgi:hypothetical protein